MEIALNGMKYLEHNEFYLSHLALYLTIVFVKDISTGHTKEYADFLDAHATKEDIEQIMRVGFKPYELKKWLVENLDS